jgi:uncharacterized protein YbjT (DUF2867 family)
MYFVAGITGHVGGATAKKLLEQGKPVRALVRDPKKASNWADQGVELVQGGFSDAEALAKALDGVEGAFLLVPPIMTQSADFPESKAIISNFRTGLLLAPPPRLVVLSSMGSEQGSNLGLITVTHLLEEALGDLPFPSAFIRAGGFIENIAGALATAKATGNYYSFYQPLNFAVPTIATEDIGREVATLLTGEWSGKRIIELGSVVSANDFANALSQVIGQPVSSQAVPRERWAATIESFGLPPLMVPLYEEMLDSINSGWIHFGVPGTESVAATITPAEFFAKLNEANA